MEEHVTDEMIKTIYNDGERLIPGISHDFNETIRHFSSYQFFKSIIELDINYFGRIQHSPITILDIGCGVGHGCYKLSFIDGVRITGIDVSSDTISFAKRHYAAKNIEYNVGNIAELAEKLPSYDYIVSRGALEHVKDGFQLANKLYCSSRLIFDVPYGEPAGRNPHHVLTNVSEKDFEIFGTYELLFQDLQGKIFPKNLKQSEIPNMVLCIKNFRDLPLVETHIHFPFEAWNLETELDELCLFLSKQVDAQATYQTSFEREAAIEKLRKFEALLTQQALLLNGLNPQESDFLRVGTEALNQRESDLQRRESDLKKRERAYSEHKMVKLYRKLKNLL